MKAPFAPMQCHAGRSPLGRTGSTDAEKAADKLKKDTEKFQEALEGVQDGIDQAFDAFLGMMQGRNVGKMVVRTAVAD